MFATVALPFDAYQALPPQEFKLLAALSRYSDRAGKAYPTLRQLARDTLLSLSTTWRAMARLRDRGCLTTRRRGRGRFVYEIAEAFRPAWPARVSPKPEHGVPQAETQEAYPTKHEKEGARRARFAKILDRTLGEAVPPPVDWVPRMRGWRQTRFWQPHWGPKPCEPGCWVPKALLAS